MIYGLVLIESASADEWVEDFDPEFETEEAARWAEWGDHVYW